MNGVSLRPGTRDKERSTGTGQRVRVSKETGAVMKPARPVPMAAAKNRA